MTGWSFLYSHCRLWVCPLCGFLTLHLVVWFTFFIIYLFFLGGARREDSPPVSGGLCRPPRRHTFSLCKQLICMAMTFVAPVISSDNGRACKADLKTYSLIMCC